MLGIGGTVVARVRVGLPSIGRSPELDPVSGALGVRPKDMDPYWVEVPVLHAISRWSKGLVSTVEATKS